jgi:hypothetical protein
MGMLTVRDIREAIKGVADDVEITFGQTRNCIPIDFCRFKWRGENLLRGNLIALKAADRAWDDGNLDFSQMEEYPAALLQAQ